MKAGSYLYYRHSLPVRVMHWINVVSLVILLMSGLQIFNAHPALYWGKSSYTARPPILQIGARTGSTGEPEGFVRLWRYEFATTGVLGVFKNGEGNTEEHAFPSWLTVPGPYWLSMARSWHFFFAWLFAINGITYIFYSIASGHLAHDLAPTRDELLRIGRSIIDHLRFRHAVGDEARRYNVLQKIAYLLVIFGLLPLVALAGWAMSPWLDTVIPGWVDWFGGRQSARSIHFLVAWLLVGFVAIHVFEVFVSGVWNHLRSMITGNYRITRGSRDEARP